MPKTDESKLISNLRVEISLKEEIIADYKAKIGDYEKQIKELKQENKDFKKKIMNFIMEN